MTVQEFMQKQSLPYEAKLIHAELRAQEFYEEMDGKVFVSLAGLDSLTLLFFLRKYVNKGIPGASVSSLEDKSIQRIHQTLENIEILIPGKSKVQVIKEFGYPVISKEKARKIQHLQNPSCRNVTVRHAIMTGETGKKGGFKFSPKMMLPKKWIELFAGLENEKFGTDYKSAPFKVSSDCCYHMKEKPCLDYAKKTERQPYMGLIASEGGQRQKALIKNGCNFYGKTVTRSCPFAIFTRQDLLQLAIDLKVPVPEIYGIIDQKSDGTLFTTKAQRTGCAMCGFGIHIEPRPHRFDRIYEEDPREWRFWLITMGWGEVLDYIGVEWRIEGIS